MGSVAPPLNNRAAVIEQIVSARSGILVWSSTMYVSPDLDVRDQGPLIKEALAAYETRGYSTILNSPRDTPNAPTRTSDEERSSASRAASGAETLRRQRYLTTPPPSRRKKRHPRCRVRVSEPPNTFCRAPDRQYGRASAGSPICNVINRSGSPTQRRQRRRRRSGHDTIPGHSWSRNLREHSRTLSRVRLRCGYVIDAKRGE